MEPSIYGSNSSMNDLRGLKKSMTLDFNTGPSAKAKKTLLLQSPDLNMLKLASPELEKMIMQASNMVTTTPTPTQFVFPKFVTEEQEAYARGFVDALAQLKSCDGPDDIGVQPKQPSPAKAVLSSNAFNIGQDYFPITSVASLGGTGLPETTLHQLTTTTTTLPNGVVLSSASLPVSSAAGLDMKPRILTDNCHGSSASVDIHMAKDEQTVPCLGSSPPLSPINMESQERIKLERKRARNRVAARKCRTRKLERISRLEDRVKDLKGQNSDLLTTATSLREQVMKLKQQIVEHCNSGCQIMIQNIKL